MAHRKRHKGRKRKYQVYARKTKRSRRRHRKGLLMEGAAPRSFGAHLKSVGRSAFTGILGAIAVKLTNKMIKPSSPLAILGIGAAEGAVLGYVFKSPLLTASIMGASAAIAAQQIPMLNDGMMPHNYVDSQMLNDLPMYLDEDGNAMIQGEDGNFYYVDEGNAYSLAQNAGNFNQIYPGYINPGFYDR